MQRVDVAKHLLAEVEAEGAAHGMARGAMADVIVELGLKALRAEKARAGRAARAASAAVPTTQEALMAI